MPFLAYVYYAWHYGLEHFPMIMEKNWKWSDGSLWDYDPWAIGYPKPNVSACSIINSWSVDSSTCKHCGMASQNCSDKTRTICKVKL